MTDIEKIDSSPEILNMETELDSLLGYENHSEPEKSKFPFRKIKGSNIYLVNIDNYPRFYCSSFQEAKKQAYDYLEKSAKYFDSLRDYSSNNYRLEGTGKKVKLLSTYKWCIIKYDSVESVAEIVVIPRIENNSHL